MKHNVSNLRVVNFDVLTDFLETWRIVWKRGSIFLFNRLIRFGAKEKLSHDEAKNKLFVEREKKRAAIEAEAVKIGL